MIWEHMTNIVPLSAFGYEPATIQLPERFDRIEIDTIPGGDTHLLVHNLSSHLVPGGELAMSCDVPDIPWPAFGLLPGDPASETSVFVRTTRTTIHDIVAEARQVITRLTPQQVADGDWLVLDTRTPTDRAANGIVNRSIHTPRTQLEWLCDPTSGYTNPAITSFDQRIVVVCNEGYSSSLAAASLHRLGFVNAADMIGGIAAWQRAGLPLMDVDR